MLVDRPSCLARPLAAAAVAACVAAFAGPVLAAPGMLDAWHATQSHDPSYAAALAGVRVGAAEQRQAAATLRPQVVMSANGAYGSDDRESTGARFSAPGFGASNDAAFRTRVAGGLDAGWSLALQQPLYSEEKRAASRQLERQADRADAQLAVATQQAILETARGYLAVLDAEARVASLQSQRATVEEALKAARAMYDEGRLPITDTTEAEARLDEIRAAQLAAEDMLAERRAAFADRTGLPADALRPVAADAPVAAIEAGRLDDWLQRARREGPQPRLRRVELDVARAEADKTAHAWSPTVDLVARVADDRLHGDSGWGTGTLSTRSRYVGVQVSVPVFTSGLRDARHEASVARADQAEAAVRGADLEATRQARGAWLALRTALSQLEAHGRMLQSAQARVDATRLGHEVGARTMLELLDAQSQRDRARLAVEQSRLAAIAARLELAAAAGALGEDELRAADALLAAP